MATPNPEDTNQPDNTNTGNDNIDIPALVVPDLNNTLLEDAIKDGMKVGDAEYIIRTP